MLAQMRRADFSLFNFIRNLNSCFPISLTLILIYIISFCMLDTKKIRPNRICLPACLPAAAYGTAQIIRIRRIKMINENVLGLGPGGEQIYPQC